MTQKEINLEIIRAMMSLARAMTASLRTKEDAPNRLEDAMNDFVKHIQNAAGVPEDDREQF